MDAILQWVDDNQSYAGLAVFGFACMEAFVGIGLFVSAAILFSICTFLYVQELMTIVEMLPLAFAGAFLGDQSGYWLGWRIGPAFLNTNFAKRHDRRIQRSQALIERFGWGAVLAGRFITPLRSVVPLLTGISGLKPARFILFDLLAVSLWTLGLWGLVVGTGKLF